MMPRDFALAAFLFLAAAALTRAQVVELNGDFEKGDAPHAGKPTLWDQTDGLAVQWTSAPVLAGQPAHGKAIRLDTSLTEQQAVASYAKAGLTQWVFPHPSASKIAASYGVSLYSEVVPVIPGKTYQVTFDYLAEKGTAAKLWCRGYANGNAAGGQPKRSYEGIIDCGGHPGEWQHISGVFHPTKHTPNVTTMKFMLFAYYPPGVVWFDNVRVEAVDEPAAP